MQHLARVPGDEEVGFDQLACAPSDEGAPGVSGRDSLKLKKVGLISACPEMGDADITASIGALHAQTQTLMNVAADLTTRYSANLQVPAVRTDIYEEAEMMATGSIRGISKGSITAATQLTDFLSETLDKMDTFESSVRSAGAHLESMRMLTGLAGNKKLRRSVGDVEVNDVGANLEFSYKEEALPLPSYARLDTCGTPLAVLRGAQDEKPFLSQFRRPADPVCVCLDGVCFGRGGKAGARRSCRNPRCSYSLTAVFR
eukprot:SAG22_NODE_75_length_22256_cov_45.062960_20_plen_258_part_00